VILEIGLSSNKVMLMMKTMAKIKIWVWSIKFLNWIFHTLIVITL